MTNKIYYRLGWLFCEAAFRIWNVLPDKWPGPLNRVMPGSFYVLGCWFYKQGTDWTNGQAGVDLIGLGE